MSAASTSLKIGDLLLDASNSPPSAFLATDLSDWWKGPDTKGSDTDPPLRDGSIARPRRVALTRYLAVVLVDGSLDEAGAAIADPAEGLERHLRRLGTLKDPNNTVGGTRDANDDTLPLELTLISGTVLTGSGHVVNVRHRTVGPAHARVTIDVSVPTGRLT